LNLSTSLNSSILNISFRQYAVCSLTLPAPIRVTIFESFFAKYFAATAVVAAVLISVIYVPASIATGSPVSSLCRVINAVNVGKSYLCGFSGKK